METRPLRADAQRNRDRLLAVAVRAFSQGGPDVPLDAIAREAGVGIGTLYRHFPTREALVEAAYRTELDKLCDAAPALLTTLPPDLAAVTARRSRRSLLSRNTSMVPGPASRFVMRVGGRGG